MSRVGPLHQSATPLWRERRVHNLAQLEQLAELDEVVLVVVLDDKMT